MRKVRYGLGVLLAIACCSSIVPATKIVNAVSTTVSLEEATISAGSTTAWYPTSDSDGFQLTNGGTQKLDIYVTVSGNKLATGVMKTSSSTKYSFYSGTLSGKTTGILSKTLSGATGYYKVYVTNNNSTVDITVTDSSYFTYK